MTIFLCRLVIIVSLGFGIVKPRLGPLLNRWSKENAFQENDSYFQGSRHRGSLLFACQRRGTYHTCRVHRFHNKNQRENFPRPTHKFRFCPIPGVPTCDPPKERPQQQNFVGGCPSCCYWRLNMLVMKQSREHKVKERTKEDYFFFSPL